MKDVVIATLNPGKIAGVHTAFEAHGPQYGWDNYEIIPIESHSGIDTTPITDDAGLIGCKNRLTAARSAQPQADLYIALEGVIASVRDRKYVRGWTMMHEPSTGRLVTASGASIEVPNLIASQVQYDQEFNHLVRDRYPVDEQARDMLRTIGANGAFTQGEYARQDSFYDGVRICLSLLANPNNWPDKQT